MKSSVFGITGKESAWDSAKERNVLGVLEGGDLDIILKGKERDWKEKENNDMENNKMEKFWKNNFILF